MSPLSDAVDGQVKMIINLLESEALLICCSKDLKYEILIKL
jgi:hypothetical protein